MWKKTIPHTSWDTSGAIGVPKNCPWPPRAGSRFAFFVTPIARGVSQEVWGVCFSIRGALPGVSAPCLHCLGMVLAFCL